MEAQDISQRMSRSAIIDSHSSQERVISCGTHIIATEMNPRRLVAQPIPSPSYIWKVKSGKTAPTVYRMRPLAAMAEAPLSGP